MRSGVVTIGSEVFTAAVCVSFLDRLLGIHAHGTADAVVIDGNSVHGFSLLRPLPVLAVRGDGVVLGSKLLRPFGLFTCKGAEMMIEFPEGSRGLLISQIRRVAFRAEGAA